MSIISEKLFLSTKNLLFIFSTYLTFSVIKLEHPTFPSFIFVYLHGCDDDDQLVCLVCTCRTNVVTKTSISMFGHVDVVIYILRVI